MLSKNSYSFFFTTFLLLVLPSGSVSAAFYKWVDKDGNTHYSDVAPDKAKVEEINLEPMNRIQGFDASKVDSMVNKEGDKKDSDQSAPAVSLHSNEGSFECFAPSPKTSNTALERKPLKESEYENISSLFSKIKGRWKGEGVITTCNGTAESPKIKVDKYDTTSEFRLRRSKEIVADFDMYSSKLRKSTDAHIKLFLSETQLTFSPSQSDKTVALNLSENIIELWVEQYSYYGTRKELVRTFKLDSNKLEVGEYSYSNGALESSSLWSLSR